MTGQLALVLPTTRRRKVSTHCRRCGSHGCVCGPEQAAAWLESVGVGWGPAGPDEAARVAWVEARERESEPRSFPGGHTDTNRTRNGAQRRTRHPGTANVASVPPSRITKEAVG